MSRSAPAVVAVAIFACAASTMAASSPTPVPSNSKAMHHVPGLSNKIHKLGPATSRISAADCNRRAGGLPPLQSTVGPNGASSSATVVAVPIGGSNAAAATRQAQINEACAHQRR